ncbi:MAG: fibronectin type III-like domain-contianing protein [Limisphaerales bacterium]
MKNTGARAGTEVAQLYIRDVAASAGPRPVRELKGFQKILLQPGESREVTFAISGQELGYYDAKGQWLVEPGKISTMDRERCRFRQISGIQPGKIIPLRGKRA